MCVFDCVFIQYYLLFGEHNDICDNISITMVHNVFCHHQTFLHSFPPIFSSADVKENTFVHNGKIALRSCQPFFFFYSYITLMDLKYSCSFSPFSFITVNTL